MRLPSGRTSPVNPELDAARLRLRDIRRRLSNLWREQAQERFCADVACPGKLRCTDPDCSLTRAS